MKPFLTLTALFLVGELVQPIALHAGTRTCQCIDRGDIKKRLSETRAAIDEYRQQIEVMHRQEQKTGERLKYTANRYKNMQSRVQSAIDSAGRAEEPPRIGVLAAAKTDAWTCTTEISNPAISPCMRESVDTHEGVHRRECQRLTNYFGRAATGEGWLEKKSLADVAREEIEAYEAEIAFLEREQASMPCDYRPEYDGLQGKKCNGPGGVWRLRDVSLPGIWETLFTIDGKTLRGSFEISADSPPINFGDALADDWRTCRYTVRGSARFVEAEEPYLEETGVEFTDWTCDPSRVPRGGVTMPPFVPSTISLDTGSFCDGG